MKSLSERKPQTRLDDLGKKIQDLEWKIQTTSLSVKDEMVIVEQVKRLETKRAVYRQLQELKNRLLELQTETKALETQAKLKHEELSQLANQSQEFHKQIVENMSRIETLRQNAGQAHEMYLEFRQRADKTHERCVETQQQIRSLKEELRTKEKQQYVEKEHMLREEATTKAREKMKRGEKLTWDEFKLLTDEQEATEH